MGWGPRGDSGSARGRVRATQPFLNLSRYDRLIDRPPSCSPKTYGSSRASHQVRRRFSLQNMPGINNLRPIQHLVAPCYGVFGRQLKPARAGCVLWIVLAVIVGMGMFGI